MTKKLAKNSFLNKFGHKDRFEKDVKFSSTFGSLSHSLSLKRGLTMAAFIQEAKMPVDKDWFTMAVSRGTMWSEHSNSKDVVCVKRTKKIGLCSHGVAVFRNAWSVSLYRT